MNVGELIKKYRLENGIKQVELAKLCNIAVSTIDSMNWGYINEGYSRSRTERTAKEWVALPGTSYEPWHYRYVGVQVANEIYERNICLEEYFE